MATEAARGLEQLFSGQVRERARYVLRIAVALGTRRLDLVADSKLDALTDELTVGFGLVKRIPKAAVAAYTTEAFGCVRV